MTKRIAYSMLAAFGVLMLTAAAHAADFDPKAATEAYLATITGEARAKSDAYFEGGYWLLLVDAVYGIAVALLLLFTRLSAGMRAFAERIMPWRWLQTLFYAMMFIVATAALTFPLTHYEGFAREHEFGLSNQTFQEWLNEYFIGLAVDVVLSGIFITIIYAVIRRAPRTWWIWGAAATAIFMALAIMISPVYISPLFNDYKPMREGELKQDILSLARANGIPVTDVYEVDASKQSKRISANVQGFLATTRISLNDNLLNRSTPAEVRAVMAHEMGHYVLGHVNEMIVYLSVLAAVGFAFVQGGFGVLHRAFGHVWRVRDITDPAGLPVALILFSLFGLAATPVQNTIIRSNEAEADLFGLNAAREPDGFATTALKLSEYRKLDPTPWEEVVFYDHPSGRSRIWMAMQWKAENLNTEATPEPAAPATPAGAPPEAAAAPATPPQPAPQ